MLEQVVCNFYAPILLLLWCVQYGNAIGIKDIVKSESYDKHIRPNFGREPVNITTQVYIASLGPVDESTFTYEVGYYHRQWWNDPRLKFNGSDALPITHNFPPDDYMWTPDTVVVNARTFTRFQTSVRTIISSEGEVYVSQRMKVTCSCVMNLRKFPMDTQRCPFILESFAINTNYLQLSLHKVPVIYEEENVELSGYKLVTIESKKLIPQYQIVGNSTEYYDNLVFTFVVRRTLTYYVYRAYAPTMILMIFNFASYWIPPSAVPARATIIVTTVLTNILILQSVTEQTVKVKYSTPMQIFLLVNILFILFSIIEYIVVLSFGFYIHKFPKNRSTGIINSSFELEKQHADEDVTENRSNNIQSHKLDEQHYPQKSQIDHVCQITLPLLYSLFCAVYFAYYQKD